MISYLQYGILTAFGGFVIGTALYYNHDIKKTNKKPVTTYGKADIGGDFNLINHFGQPVNVSSFAGKWVLLYFGFCRCPDICPEQIERLVEIHDRLRLTEKTKYELVPVFLSVDPERDTPDIVAKYVKEFSPHLVGLTGTKEEIGRVAKSYRIYYSSGPKDVDGDYIVDHTVVMYLLNHKGEFCGYFGQNKPVYDIVKETVKMMNEAI